MPEDEWNKDTGNALKRLEEKTRIGKTLNFAFESVRTLGEGVLELLKVELGGIENLREVTH